MWLDYVLIEDACRALGQAYIAPFFRAVLEGMTTLEQVELEPEQAISKDFPLLLEDGQMKAVQILT